MISRAFLVHRDPDEARFGNGRKEDQRGGRDQRAPLVLAIADDEGDPTKAAIIAKKFIEVEKVTAIIGPTRTDTGMAAKPVIEQMKVPTVMTVGGDAIILGGKFGPFHWTFKSPSAPPWPSRRSMAT